MRTPSPASRAGPRARSGRPPRRRARAAGRSEGAPRPGAGRPLRTSLPVPRLGLVHAAAHRPDEAGRPAPIPSVEPRVGHRLGAPPRARAGRPSSGGATPRAPPSTSAGTSAATRERSPSVSMAVTGRMAQAPADRPVHRLLTPAPYGLTTPSPLTTTRGDAARVIPARTWTGRSAPGSRGRGTRRSDLRARRSRCRSAPRCPRTAR